MLSGAVMKKSTQSPRGKLSREIAMCVSGRGGGVNLPGPGRRGEREVVSQLLWNKYFLMQLL